MRACPDNPYRALWYCLAQYVLERYAQQGLDTRLIGIRNRIRCLVCVALPEKSKPLVQIGRLVVPVSHYRLGWAIRRRAALYIFPRQWEFWSEREPFRFKSLQFCRPDVLWRRRIRRLRNWCGGWPCSWCRRRTSHWPNRWAWRGGSRRSWARSWRSNACGRGIRMILNDAGSPFPRQGQIPN